MKHKSIFLFAIIASLASFILSSCDDELYRTNSIGSELKEDSIIAHLSNRQFRTHVQGSS